MKLTKKGIKMNISKCLKKYEIKQSEEKATSVRGEHDITKGYRFVDMDETNEIIMYWNNKDKESNSHSEKIKEIYELLILHGFSDYINFNESDSFITIANFRE